MAEDRLQGEQAAPCGCMIAPGGLLVDERELGMDEDFAQVSLMVCSACGQQWLRYFYEVEAFTASGRWYLGAITAEQASNYYLVRRVSLSRPYGYLDHRGLGTRAPRQRPNRRLKRRGKQPARIVGKHRASIQRYKTQ